MHCFSPPPVHVQCTRAVQYTVLLSITTCTLYSTVYTVVYNTVYTLTRGGRQKGSSPLANYYSGSKATNLLGRWSPYDGTFQVCTSRKWRSCMGPRLPSSWAHTASSLDAGWTHLNVDLPYQDFIKSWQAKSTFKCVHQENEEAVWAHFTSLGAFKCIHPASRVKWSRNIVVKLFGAFYWCLSCS